jgi:hypothetical protein
VVSITAIASPISAGVSVGRNEYERLPAGVTVKKPSGSVGKSLRIRVSAAVICDWMASITPKLEESEAVWTNTRSVGSALRLDSRSDRSPGIGAQLTLTPALPNASPTASRISSVTLTTGASSRSTEMSTLPWKIAPA